MATTTEVIRIEADTLDDAISELQKLKAVLEGPTPASTGGSLYETMASASISVTVGPVTITVTIST